MLQGLPEFALGPPLRDRPDTITTNHASGMAFGLESRALTVSGSSLPVIFCIHVRSGPIY